MKNYRTNIIVLLIVFFAIVVFGKYYFKAKPIIINNIITSTSTPQNTPQSTSPSVSTESNMTSKTVVEDREATRIAQCAAALKADTEKSKTAYDKGTILVGFTTGVTFDDAKQVLSSFGIHAQYEPDAKESYPNRRLISVSVPKGQEFTKICTVESHESVRYAGINPLISLHE